MRIRAYLKCLCNEREKKKHYQTIIDAVCVLAYCEMNKNKIPDARNVWLHFETWPFQLFKSNKMKNNRKAIYLSVRRRNSLVLSVGKKLLCGNKNKNEPRKTKNDGKKIERKMCFISRNVELVAYEKNSHIANREHYGKM